MNEIIVYNETPEGILLLNIWPYYRYHGIRFRNTSVYKNKFLVVSYVISKMKFFLNHTYECEHQQSVNE